jgi:hypothetical protein
MTNQNQKFGNGIQYSGARGTETHKDKDGYVWLCDRGVDPNKDFKSQGCWRVDQMAFDRND